MDPSRAKLVQIINAFVGSVVVGGKGQSYYIQLATYQLRLTLALRSPLGLL